METLLIVAIAVTALAVVIQAGILVALYVSVRKTSARLEAVVSEVHTRSLPVLENFAVTSSMVRSQVERIDTALADVVDRTRLQVIRADEMLTHVMDRVEQTSEKVQHTVVSPVRQLAGIVSGLSVGINAFFGGGRRRPEGAPQDEEMFI